MAAGDYEFGFCPGDDPCMYILAATKGIASVSSNYPALKAFSGVSGSSRIKPIPCI